MIEKCILGVGTPMVIWALRMCVVREFARSCSSRCPILLLPKSSCAKPKSLSAKLRNRFQEAVSSWNWEIGCCLEQNSDCLEWWEINCYLDKIIVIGIKTSF